MVRELNGLAATASAALAEGRAPSRWRNQLERESAGIASLRHASVWLDSLHAINPLISDGPLWGSCLSQLVLQPSRADAAAAVPYLSSRPRRTGPSNDGARRNPGETGLQTDARNDRLGSHLPRPARPRHAEHSQAPRRPDLRAYSDFVGTGASTQDALLDNTRRVHRDVRRAEDGDASTAGPNVNELPLRADLPLLAHFHHSNGTARNVERSRSSSTSFMQGQRDDAPFIRDAQASEEIQLPSRASAQWPLAPGVDRDARRNPVVTHITSSWSGARQDWQAAVSRRIARVVNCGVPLAVASNAEGQPSSQAQSLQAQWSKAQWSWLLAGPTASRDLLGKLAAITHTEDTTLRDAAPRRESSAGTAHRNVESFDASRRRNGDDRTSVDAGTHVETNARQRAAAPFGPDTFSPNDVGVHAEPNGRAVYVDSFSDVGVWSGEPGFALSSLPPLLPPSETGVAAPTVVAAISRQGALSEALSPDEDLDALADKIKLILDEQARRHGIDV